MIITFRVEIDQDDSDKVIGTVLFGRFWRIANAPNIVILFGIVSPLDLSL